MNTNETQKQSKIKDTGAKRSKKLSHYDTMELIDCSIRTGRYRTLFKKMEKGLFPFNDAIAIDMAIRFTLERQEPLITLLKFVKESGFKLSYSEITINKIFNTPMEENVVRALSNHGEFGMMDHAEPILWKVKNGAKTDLQCTVNALLEVKHFLEAKRRRESA